MHWLPLLWIAVLLLICVQVCWTMFGPRFHRDWSFLKYCTVLAQTATLYVMAAVTLPQQVDEDGATSPRTSTGIIAGASPSFSPRWS